MSALKLFLFIGRGFRIYGEEGIEQGKIELILNGFKKGLSDDFISKIINFKPEGSPITKEELAARAESSEKDIREGRVKTSNQVREEMKNW
ncbi:hypothetical protein [Pleomorphovibrio marinus]|uniref:hypothetical protein n=1 Tax=Pleomorphovibrio marinus TaxID=2164132 RepID=UPI000E0BE8A2|nr:hypothetical protein [Pleomorphovibrio marinus]